MRIRRALGAAFVAGFVALVLHLSAVNQCPASELGACARLHLALMRAPVLPAPILAAEPMRASAGERG